MQKPPLSRSTKVLSTLFIIVACALFVIVAAESFVKFFLNPPIALISYDEALGWRFVSNATTDKALTTNAYGFRWPTRSQTADPQKFRILVLGDSYTAGLAC